MFENVICGVKVVRLSEDAIVPTYAKEGDAGADLYANETVVLRPGERQAVSTGIALEIPSGYAGFVHPRSGLSIHAGVSVINSPGTIDSGYRGEVKVLAINHDPYAQYTISKGMRIAQLVFQRVSTAKFFVTERLSESARGNGGFGSTGA